MYSLVSVLQFAHFAEGYDLALFSQAVWRYSRFELPRSTLLSYLPGDPSLHLQYILGDHFHPIVALLAPLYWVWPDARMLLVAQAALIAASVIPVFFFSRERLGRVGALLLSVGTLPTPAASPISTRSDEPSTDEGPGIA